MLVSRGYSTAEDPYLVLLFKVIFEQHSKYLELEETENRAEAYQKLKYDIKTYLNNAPHNQKFQCDATYSVLENSLAGVKEKCDLKRLIKGFEAIHQFAANLYARPWRREFKTIRMYSGFYTHHVDANLCQAFEMFLAMGYEFKYDQTLVCPDFTCHDQVQNVSRDAIMAIAELEIMQDIYDHLKIIRSVERSFQDIYAARVRNKGDVDKICFILRYQGDDDAVQSAIDYCGNNYSNRQSAGMGNMNYYPEHFYDQLDGCRVPNNIYPQNGIAYTCAYPRQLESLNNHQPVYYSTPCATNTYNMSGNRCPLPFNIASSFAACDPNMAALYPSGYPIRAQYYQQPMVCPDNSYYQPSPVNQYQCPYGAINDSISHEPMKPEVLNVPKYSNSRRSRSELINDNELNGNNMPILQERLKNVEKSRINDLSSSMASELENFTENESINGANKNNDGYGSAEKWSSDYDKYKKKKKPSSEEMPNIESLNIRQSKSNTEELRSNSGRTEKDITSTTLKRSSRVDPAQQTKYNKSISSSGSRSTESSRNSHKSVDSNKEVPNSNEPGWQCQHCTFLNSNKRKVCEMCSKTHTYSGCVSTNV